METSDHSSHRRFGDLLRLCRKRAGVTLVELSGSCETDDGNLSRIERGERRPPRLPLILKILTALKIQEDSPEWREILSAAARERFEAIKYAGITYLGYDNPLGALQQDDGPAQPHQISLTEAAVEIGRISASCGVKKITIETPDGTEVFFYIQKQEAPFGASSGQGCSVAKDNMHGES